MREYKSQGVGKGLCTSFQVLVRLVCDAHETSHLLVSGEGLFVAEASGRGVLFVQAIGAIFQRQLRPGEEWIGTCLCHTSCQQMSHPNARLMLTVDNGHLVAWTCKYKVERIQASGGMLSASHTDEGLVCR